MSRKRTRPARPPGAPGERPSPLVRRRRRGLPARLRASLPPTGPRFVDGNRLRFFEEGHEALEAMLDAIRAARRFVHLETYILRSDNTGWRFLHALEERVRAGVAVRLLYDAVGSVALDTAALDRLRGAGGQVVVFHPLFRFQPRWTPRRRDHRKILVVDGEVAFTGGLNIGDEYDAAAVAGADDAGWRDTQVEVRGPAVRELSAVFLESWFRADGPELSWHLVLEHAPAPDPHGQRCAVLPDGPSYQRRTMRDLLVEALGQTRESACLTSPYFAPGPRVLEALADAARRGVRVRLLLAGATDHPLLRRAAHRLLPRLVEAGVEVYEYTAGVMHAKSAVFDQELAVVGTSNLDRQSFLHSYEVNLLFDDAAACEDVEAIFERDLARSERFLRDPSGPRGIVARVVDALLALLLRVL